MRHLRLSNAIYPDVWATSFMGSGRTSSAALSYSNTSNIIISGKKFLNIGSDISSIRLTNCQNVLITACDFDGCCQPITVYNSTNIEISWCRYNNITGPSARNGTNRADFTQWVYTNGGSIHDNKGIGGDTEDIISVIQSGGLDATHPLIIERNAFEGTNWYSTTGSGIQLADSGGSDIICRNNTLLNPGQSGIDIASGTNIHITDNIVYGAKRTASNVGISVWNQTSANACSGHEVTRNTVSWLNAAGSQTPAFNAGNCGTVTGFNTNDWYATIDPATIHVTL